MPCYHPMKGYSVGFYPSGKPKFFLTSYDTDHVELIGDKLIPMASPSASVSPHSRKVVRDFIDIPCGNCAGCRLDYSRQWADRCLMEMQYHDSSYFITLTYSDYYLPKTQWLDSDTGEFGSRSTLQKRDVQLFLKRLRKAIDYPIRYFASGEYGDRSQRAHYHLMIFGLKLDDLEFYKKGSDGINYYTSEFLSSLWTVEKSKRIPIPDGLTDEQASNFYRLGFVVVGAACWQTANYVARYMLKKQKGKAASYYDDYNIAPEFSLMSTHPGIGRQFLDDHPEIMELDSLPLSTSQGRKDVVAPRYFSKVVQKMQENGVDNMDNVVYNIDMSERSRRRMEKARARIAAKLAATSLDHDSYLETEELIFENRISSLKQDL